MYTAKTLYPKLKIIMLFCLLPIMPNAMELPEGVVPDQYIIKLQTNENIATAANAMAQQHGLRLGHLYKHALHGFSAHVPARRLKVLKNDPRVVSVVEDRYVSIIKKCFNPPCNDKNGPPPEPVPQSIPTGILRIMADLSSTEAGNGSGMVDVDVAVIDTGVADHVDLNVVGGVNCTKGGGPRGYDDEYGHGTHVAGTIAAYDNDIGVVGVAPGARIWAVKVLKSGWGYISDVICGVDWVTGQADIVEVANMSLGGNGTESGCADGWQQEAICNSVEAGVTYVVAAGNSGANARNFTPAAYDQVITVSALADYDGLAGGLSGSDDDIFASFSNYGEDIDLIAPGVHILSTYPNDSYMNLSGTSMASPHVAGAAALYLSIFPDSTPDEVKNALQMSGSLDWDNSNDPDGNQEVLLDVSGF